MSNKTQQMRAQKNEEIKRLKSELNAVKKQDELLAQKAQQITDMGNEIVKMRLELEETRAKHSCPKCHKDLPHERCPCNAEF